MNERMDSFKKPFRAVPVQLGEEVTAQRRRENRQLLIGMAIRMALVMLLIFLTGMVITNSGLSRFLPSGPSNAAAGDPPVHVHYRSCAAARATGHAPVHTGSPGYRLRLDGDGIACEPYIDP